MRRVHRETNPRIEKAAMKAKKSDAISHAKRLRRDKFHAKQALITSYMGLNSKVRDRIAKINKNTKALKKGLIKEILEKFDHLKQKQCTDPRGDLKNCDSKVVNILQNVNIFQTVKGRKQ